jgi:hypothetical protein
MPAPTFTPASSPSSRAAAANRLISRSIAIAAAVIAGSAIVATLVLWSHYGTAVFYEIIAAGIAACL